MRVSTSDSATDWLVTAPLKTADVESCKTVVVLEELLAQSIHLRDLYKHAGWQTSDIQYPSRGTTTSPLANGNTSPNSLVAVTALMDFTASLRSACINRRFLSFLKTTVIPIATNHPCAVRPNLRITIRHF